MSWSLIVHACAAVATGCGPVSVDAAAGSPDTTAAPASTTDDGAPPTGSSSEGGSTGATIPGPDTTAASTSTSAEADTGAPVVFDLAPVPDAPQYRVDEACGEVDFLFVIDDSSGMENAQAKLLASAPGFIDEVRAQLASVERFHVAVVTSDAYAGNGPECNALGDLVTQTAGMGAGGETCSFEEGHRFATEADDLDAAFTCMAQVGTSGSSLERPVTATIAAVDRVPVAGSCNEGFIRAEAVLVVVIVTDDIPSAREADDANLDDPDAPWWASTLAFSTQEQGAATVVIGLVPWSDTSCTGEESPNLIGFVEGVGEWRVLASVCEPNYAAVLGQAIWMIESACDSFIDNLCEVPGGC